MRRSPRTSAVSRLLWLALAALAASAAWAADAQPAPAAKAFPMAPSDTLFKRESFVYTPGNRPDPFIPLSKAGGAGLREVSSLDIANITLKGTLWGPSGRLALVHDPQGVGYVVQEGDQLIGGKITAITDTSVVFEQGEGELRVRFMVLLSGKREMINIKQ